MTTIDCPVPDHLACTSVTVELHLTEEFVRDVFTTAIEGGINYWASVTEYRWTETDPRDVRAVINDDQDEGKEYRVTLETVAKGIGAVLAKPQLRPGLVANIMELDAGEIDADDADVIVQMGLLGEVTYG